MFEMPESRLEYCNVKKLLPKAFTLLEICLGHRQFEGKTLACISMVVGRMQNVKWG